MTTSLPTPTHYAVEHLGNAQRFTIPSRKIWYVMVTTGFGVVIWTTVSIVLSLFLPGLFNSILNPVEVEEAGVLHLLITGVLLAGLAFWLFLGVFIGRMFLGHLAGKEIIEVTPHSIILSRRIFNVGRQKVYQTGHVKNLRFSPPSQAPDLPGAVIDPYGISLTIDWLAFEYDKKTVWFARGLDEAGAKQLLEAIKENCEL